MMLYERSKDRKKFYRKVAKAIGQDDDDEGVEDAETRLGGDLDLDDILPPSSGHEVGKEPRTPMNTSRRTPARGSFIDVKKRGESLDETLEKNINRVIVEVMGSTNRAKIGKFVETLHSHDAGRCNLALHQCGPTSGLS